MCTHPCVVALGARAISTSCLCRLFVECVYPVAWVRHSAAPRRGLRVTCIDRMCGRVWRGAYSVCSVCCAVCCGESAVGLWCGSIAGATPHSPRATRGRAVARRPDDFGPNSHVREANRNPATGTAAAAPRAAARRRRRGQITIKMPLCRYTTTGPCSRSDATGSRSATPSDHPPAW